MVHLLDNYKDHLNQQDKNQKHCDEKEYSIQSLKESQRKPRQ